MKRRFKKFKHEWTHEINWNTIYQFMVRKRKIKMFNEDYGWDDLDEEL